MHHCLEVTEIFQLIVEEVFSACEESAIDEDDAWQQSQTTWISLAKTCKLFYEPAMDALWEDVSDIEPILSGFFAVLESEAETTEVGRDLQWTRFFRNAARIRMIELSWYQDLADHLGRLSLRNDSKAPIFTNMRDIFCEDTRQDVVWYLPLFLNPNLTHFRFGSHTPTTAEVTGLSLEFLAEMCPGLETLHCPAYAQDQIFTKFPNLVDFSTQGGLAPSVFRHFSTLPRLQHLQLDFTHLIEDIPEPSDASTFPQLSSIQLSIANASHGPRLMRLIRSTNLRKLKIFFGGTVNSGHVNEFLQVLVTSHSGLVDISVATFANSPQEVDNIGPPISIREFSPLRNLEALTIAYSAISFKEDDIEVLGEGCPRLAHIDVATGWMYTPLQSAILPVKAIETFAMHMPSLRYLSIDIDTRTVHEAPRPTRRNTHPLTLRVYHNIIDDPEVLPLAMYISDVYPEANVTTPPYLDLGVIASDVDKLWLMVHDGVPLFAQARRRALEQWASASAL